MCIGVNMQKDALLSRIAYLYYIEGKSQAAIAQELQIYRTSISRYLKQARELGLVSIEIKDFRPEILDLERRLKQKLQLRQVHVVDVSTESRVSQKQEVFSKGLAVFLRQYLRHEMTIGLVWGTSIAEMVQAMETKHLHGASVVPLVGGPGHTDSHYHVNTLVYEMSKKLSAQAQFIQGTIIEESPETKRAIMASKYFQEVAEAWKKLDLVVTGVGRGLKELNKWQNLLTEEDQEELRLNGVIGDCCGRFFDKDGRVLRTVVNQRTIALELEQLQTAKHSVLVLSSKQKIRPMLALLKGGYHNTLVIDSDTARECLRRMEKEK